MAPNRPDDGGQGEDPEGDSSSSSSSSGEEEDVEGREVPNVPNTSSPPPPLPPRSPPLTAISALPLVKKPRGSVPDLYDCHRCGRRFPDKGQRRERLRPMSSQWRVVLLCEECLRAVASAEVCSYCFSKFVERERDGGFADCRECDRRVHLRCLPEQRGYLVPTDLDPDLFACIDCRPLPLSRIGKRGKIMDPSAARVCSLSLGNVVKDVISSDRMARGAFDLVPNGDLDLARRSHYANSECSINCVREWFDVDLLEESPSRVHCVCGEVEVELFTEAEALETKGIADVQSLNVTCAPEGGLDMREDKYQSKEVTLRGKDATAVMPSREEQASSSHMLVISVGCDTTTPMQGEKPSVPDRYMKKYYRRRSRIDRKENNSSASLPMPMNMGPC